MCLAQLQPQLVKTYCCSRLTVSAWLSPSSIPACFYWVEYRFPIMFLFKEHGYSESNRLKFAYHAQAHLFLVFNSTIQQKNNAISSLTWAWPWTLMKIIYICQFMSANLCLVGSCQLSGYYVLMLQDSD